MIQQALARLLEGHDLSRNEARRTMAVIMAGEATDAQIAGFLVALRAKGETADEIAGCAEAMREHVLRVNPTRTDIVDVVGTGGDGANTYRTASAVRPRKSTGGRRRSTRQPPSASARKSGAAGPTCSALHSTISRSSRSSVSAGVGATR